MREFELLQHVYDASRRLPASVEIGPGDDMAALRLGGGAGLLAAVDQVVDGRHVELDRTPLELVGRKAVTRSLSDVAAMAGRPLAALVAVTLPRDFEPDRARRLFDAMRHTAELYACPLVGGDIAFHASAGDPLVASVTVLGEPGPSGSITRCGARVGDTVYVTGTIGGAMTDGADGHPRHLTFEPRIAEAIELAEAIGDRLHAMIDISDGLGRDAGHLAADGAVRLELDAASVPCHEDTDWRLAAGLGEDYELLFTASGEVPSRLGKDVAVTAIGRVTSGAAGAHVIADGVSTPVDDLGWEHAS